MGAQREGLCPILQVEKRGTVTALSPRPSGDREPGWQPMPWRLLAFRSVSLIQGKEAL